MPKYLISFDDAAMTFTPEELPELQRTSSAAVEEATKAGVWVFGGGLNYDKPTTSITTDGTATDGPYPEAKERIGGFSVVDVPTREEAMEWAAKIAVACRCTMQVREFLPEPDLD